MKHKKALVFVLFVVIIAIVSLISITYLLIAKKPGSYEQWIGIKQFEILKTYQKAEKALFYIDQSAKYSAQQAIYELGQKGGHVNSDCGTYLGYAVWATFDENKNLKECYPENVEENFKIKFNQNLNDYLINYNNIESNNVIMPLNSYYIDLSGKLDIIGRAKEKLSLDIGGEEKEEELFKKDIEKGMFSWPLDLSNSQKEHYVITSCFGSREVKGSESHKGTDIRAKWDKVYAAADGLVVFAGDDYNTVIIKHADLGYETSYLHNSKILVKKDEKVKKNQLIAVSGNFGPIYYPPHLDFRVKNLKTGNWEDSLSFYDRLNLGLKYKTDSNCNYRSEQYAYAGEIKQNVIA